jgi:hypothetical protein
VREYEALVEGCGWTVGRVMGWSMGLIHGAEMLLNGDAEVSASVGDDWQDAMAGPGAQLVLSSAGDSLTCLVQAEGVPRFYRAWRGKLQAVEVAEELPPVNRYANERLDLNLDQALLCGSQQWITEVSAQCEAMGWGVVTMSRWTALMGALGS